MTVKIDMFNNSAGHPLQSWEWGEFRKSTGNEVVRFPFGQLALHKIPKTKYKIGAFIKGPTPTKKIISELIKLAKRENLLFIKLEPNIKKDDKVINLLKKSGAVPGKTLFTPTTFWIDLKKSEDELMKGFHSKTRYNIRLAQRKGVEVTEDKSKKAFEKYIEFTRETVERQGFYAHTEKYHRLMWKTLHTDMINEGKEPTARLRVARYNPPVTPKRSDGGRRGKIITTWILFVWHDFLYYPYGAWSGKHRNLMANNLIMWESIKYGQKLNLKTFDLWGREPGKGFTRFKEGYNPQVVELLGTWDLVTSPLYPLYRIADLVRWSFLKTRSKLAFAKPRF